jgi:hypothetical protein
MLFTQPASVDERYVKEAGFISPRARCAHYGHVDRDIFLNLCVVVLSATFTPLTLS